MQLPQGIGVTRRARCWPGGHAAHSFPSPAGSEDLAKVRSHSKVLPAPAAVRPPYHAFGPYRTLPVPPRVLLDRTVPTHIDPEPARKKERDNSPAVPTIRTRRLDLRDARAVEDGGIVTFDSVLSGPNHESSRTRRPLGGGVKT